jgi:hypothetical protein
MMRQCCELGAAEDPLVQGEGKRRGEWRRIMVKKHHRPQYRPLIFYKHQKPVIGAQRIDEFGPTKDGPVGRTIDERIP